MASKNFVFDMKNFVIGLLRRGTWLHPAKNEAMIQARVSRGVYRCASCSKDFKRKDINVDHCVPVVPTTGFPMLPDGRLDWTTYISRMYPISHKGYQILCVPCHKIKTKMESSERVKTRSGRKVKNANSTIGSP